MDSFFISMLDTNTTPNPLQQAAGTVPDGIMHSWAPETVHRVCGQRSHRLSSTSLKIRTPLCHPSQRQNDMVHSQPPNLHHTVVCLPGQSKPLPCLSRRRLLAELETSLCTHDGRDGGCRIHCLTSKVIELVLVKLPAVMNNSL